MQRDEEFLARQAFEIYRQLRPPRSIDKLFRTLVRMAREKGRDSVPTLHRPKLYQWAREYRWDELLAETEETVAPVDFERFRNEFYQGLVSFRRDVLQELLALITYRPEPKIQLKAIELYCRVLGLDSRRTPGGSDGASIPVPDPETTQETDLTRWLLEGPS